MTRVRIFDNPNHPHYGPVRRMWTIMAQLDLLRLDDSLFLMMHQRRWDDWLVEYMEIPLLRSESEAQCILLQHIFNAMKLPLSPKATQRVNNETNILRDMRT